MPSFKRIFLAGLTAVALAGCHRESATPVPAAPATVTVSLPEGTPVKLVLLQELTSGGSSEGTTFPLMVAEDVTDASGHVVVPKGTPVEGKVTWSRTEGTLGGLMNQPARLKFAPGEMPVLGGETVPLSADAAEGKEYELNRANTGRPEAPQLEDAMKDPQKEAALREVAELFESGKTPDRAALEKAVQNAGLSQTSRLLQKGQIDKATGLVDQIRRGAPLAGLASGGTLAAAGAVLELANLAGDVGHRLSRTLGGRNIRAYVGTPVTLYTQSPVTATVPRASS